MAIVGVLCLVAASCSSDPDVAGGVDPQTSIPGEPDDASPETPTSAAPAAASGSAETGDGSTTQAPTTQVGDSSASDTTVPVVTIEPPPATAAPIPVPESGCGGAGVDADSGVTRVGVLVPDFGALSSTGFVPRVSPLEYENRYWATFLAANQRAEGAFSGSPNALPCGEIELEIATYDPLDPSTQRDACIDLADDEGVVVVLAEIDDHRGDALECLLVEAGVPVIVAGGVTSGQLETYAGQLVSLRPPVDLLGERAAIAFADLGLLEGENVAVLSGDQPGTSEAASAVVDAIGELGLAEPLVVTLPTATGITQAWSAIPAAAEQMIAADTTVVISLFDAVITNAVWDEMVDREVTWEWLFVDASGIGEHDKVSRLPDQFAGVVVTSQESQRDADRTNAASQQCIADYEALLASIDEPGFTLPTVPPGADSPTTAPPTTVVPTTVPPTTVVSGDDSTDDGSATTVPAEPKPEEEVEENVGDGFETAARELLGEDRPPGPACASATVALRAISAAGDQLSTETFQNELAKLGPIESFIEGPGSLTSSKHYVADVVQVLRFERYLRPISEELVAPCGSPENCWRALEVDGAASLLLIDN